MPKKDQKIKPRYKDEDVLFLMLELIDFPDSKLKTFNFDELGRLNFKNPITYKAFGLMSELNKACKIELADFQFDRHNLFYLDKKGFKNYLNEIIYKTRGQQSSNSLKRVMENNFSLSDLEYLEKEQNPQFLVLLSGINFKIIIKQESRDFILSDIKEYIKFFVRDGLFGTTAPFQKFSDHENIFRMKATESYRKYKSASLVLDDSQFENDFRLLDYALALDFGKEATVNSIASKTGVDNKTNFVVSLDLTDNYLRKVGLISIKEKPQFEIAPNGKIAIFKNNSKSAEVKLRIDSQKTRFIKYLVEDFRKGVARAADSLFENVYKNNFNRNTGKYPHQLPPKERLARLQGKFKDLHRVGILTDYKLEFNKENKTFRITPLD